MTVSQSEENKNKLISAGLTAVIFGLLLLFLILYNMVTPNPPFPDAGGGGGQTMALGMINVGNDDVDFSKMGEVHDVVVQKAEKVEKIVTDENGEVVPMNEDKPTLEENKTVIKPVKPAEVVKPKSMAEIIRDKAKKNKDKKGGGHGNNDQAGQDGDIDGDPFGKGKGGIGTGTNTGIGDTDGPDKGPGVGPGHKFGVSLGNRRVVLPPKLASDTREEGKVVVDITVDSQGNVIEASPNGRGTTTNSAQLKAKAKKAAMDTKFNVDGKFEEQRGTITIIFSFE